MLRVKLLRETSQVPTVNKPFEDLGYDLYADFLGENNELLLPAHCHLDVMTGVAIEFKPRSGGIIMTRSSMAKNRIIVVGGVIDAGYRGEIVVMLENLGDEDYVVRHGDKVGQLIQNPFVAEEAQPVAELTWASRLAQGFGSSGQ